MTAVAHKNLQCGQKVEESWCADLELSEKKDRGDRGVAFALVAKNRKES